MNVHIGPTHTVMAITDFMENRSDRPDPGFITSGYLFGAHPAGAAGQPIEFMKSIPLPEGIPSWGPQLKAFVARTFSRYYMSWLSDRSSASNELYRSRSPCQERIRFSAAETYVQLGPAGGGEAPILLFESSRNFAGSQSFEYLGRNRCSTAMAVAAPQRRNENGRESAGIGHRSVRQGSRNPQFIRSRQFVISDDVRLQSDGDNRGAGLLAGRLYQTSGSSWRSDQTSVTCNQPDTGLGDIEADIGTGDTSISLRAEKDRIYTITYTATDNADNKTVKTATEREEGFGAFLIC
ncbi:hypothetical protein ASG81_09205 [Paenibacillus sp. Soil522]|nr:hypothetical protein ASG81_09205 [Paenibacillus sp. Soil522]